MQLYNIEISRASKIPDSIKSGQTLTLNLQGIMNTLHDFDHVGVRQQGNEIYLNAFARERQDLEKEPGVVMAGVEAPWKDTVKITNLKPGIYNLKFNQKFGYVFWDRAVTVL